MERSTQISPLFQQFGEALGILPCAEEQLRAAPVQAGADEDGAVA
jgi:hypothetical protein